MGFLYTWEEIRDKRIPSLKDFDQVMFEVMEALYRHDGVVAASVYGSVLRGEQNQRSDLDLAVIARNSTCPQVGFFVRELAADARVNHDVIINVCVNSVSEARRARHKFGPSYKRTFERLRGQGCEKGDLRQYLTYVSDDIDTEMLGKLAVNSQRVAEAEHFFRTVTRQNSQQSLNLWLEQCKRGSSASFRPFHLYINIARWLLWMKDHDLLEDSGRVVIERILSEPAFQDLREEFVRLASLDQEYDTLLKAVILGNVGRKTYLSRVGKMVRELFVHVKRLIRKTFVYMRSKKGRGKSRPLQTTAV